MQIKKLNKEIPYGIPKDSTTIELEVLRDRVEQLEKRFNNSKPTEKLYLTSKETMDLCGITSPSTLWNWRTKGMLIPEGRAGRKPLYLRQDVINFLKGKEVQKTGY